MPLLSEWTIARVIDWLADDDRGGDTDGHEALDAHRDMLGAIDAGIARRLRQPACPPGARTPMLVRSIATATRRHPALRALTVGDLVAGAPADPAARQSGNGTPAAGTRSLSASPA